MKEKVRSKIWYPPPEGLLKFNVDGSSLGNHGLSGVGGILRDSSRCHQGLFSLPVGEIWAFEAEVKATLCALKICKEFHLQHIIVESDSAMAVGWISNKEDRFWKLLNDLTLIDLLMEGVHCVEVFHVFRKSNAFADYLAKTGCHREGKYMG